MSLFSNILEKLGLKHPAEQATPPKPVATDAHASPQAGPLPRPTPQSTFTQPPTSQDKTKPPIAAQSAPGQPPVHQVGSIAPPPPSFIPEHHPVPTTGPIATGIPPAIPVVDVVKKLEQLAAANPYKLDWKVSIVDLLKLLGLDSSYKARKELAIELGCPADKMNDSAQMNTWLHKTVLQKIADNGGNIPKELLD